MQIRKRTGDSRKFKTINLSQFEIKHWYIDTVWTWLRCILDQLEYHQKLWASCICLLGLFEVTSDVYLFKNDIQNFIIPTSFRIEGKSGATVTSERISFCRFGGWGEAMCQIVKYTAHGEAHSFPMQQL